MKIKKKVGILITLILIILVSIFSIVVNADTITSSNLQKKLGQNIQMDSYPLTRYGFFCVHHGSNNGYNYQVSNNVYEAGDKLAYILNQADKGYWSYNNPNNAQNALWMFLTNDTTNSDQKIIAGGLTQNNWYSIESGRNIYNNAGIYSNNVNWKPTVTLKNETENQRIKVTVKGKANQKFKLTINGTNSKEHKLDNKGNAVVYVNWNSFDGENLKVEVVPKITKYFAKYVVLKSTGGYNQRLIAVTSKGSKTIDGATVEKTIKVTRDTNVSLQKYIIKVNGNSLTKNETALTNRKNAGVKENVKNAPSKDNNFNEKFKNSNVVNIEPGNNITYRIWVYNNSKYTASDIKITDNFLYYNGGDNHYTDYSDVVISGTNAEVDFDETKQEYTFTIDSLAAGSSKYIDITVKFNSYLDKIIGNKVTLTSTNPENDTTYRTEDYDFVKMKTYAVSLEKYVSKINGTEINQSIEGYENLKEYIGGNVTKERLESLRDRADINKDEKLDTADKERLEEYIGQGIGNLNFDNLKDKNADEIRDVLDKFEVSDINGDSVVDGTDEIIYNMLSGNATIELIEQFIRLDINKDGYFNDTDKNIYRTYLSDINEDRILDNTDEYLTYIYKNEISKNNSEKLDLEKIKINYLKKIENKDKDSIKNTIKYFAISDINQDGAVNEIDTLFWQDDENVNNTLKDLDTDTSNNNNKITKIKECITSYDKNGDRKVNSDDIVVAETEGEKQEIEAAIKNADYDIDGNQTIEEFGVKKYKIVYSDDSYEIIGEVAEIEEGKEIKSIQPILTGDVLILELRNRLITFAMTSLSEDIISNCMNINNNYYLYDINTDNKITIEDYNAIDSYYGAVNVAEGSICNTLEFIKFLDEYVKTYGNIDFEKINSELNISGDCYADFGSITEFIGKKEFPSELDFNKDNQLTEEDQAELVKRDLNNDSRLDYCDYEIYNTYIKVDKVVDNYQETEFSEYVAYIEQEQFTDSDKNYLLTDSNIAYENIDFNEDQKVDEEDLYIWNQYINDLGSYMDKYNSADLVTIQTLITYDVNEDGGFNNFDETKITSYLDNNYSGINADFNEDNIVDYKDVAILEVLINKSNEDIISMLNNNETRAGKAEYLTEQNGKYVDNTRNDSQWTQHNTYKYDNIVDVSNGDEVTYTIKVKNDGNTSVYITKIIDYLPDGVEYNGTSYNGNEYNKTTDNEVTFDNLKDTLIKPGKTASFEITVKVIEPNKSLNILKNTAKISEMQARNYKDITNPTPVQDTTPWNNMDSDYIQLNYPDNPDDPDDPNNSGIISGIVWNDKALDKKQDNYDGIYNDGENCELSGIKVQLYRENKGIVAETFTDVNGKYSFEDDDLNYFIDESGNKNVVEDHEKYIKAPRNEDNNRWNAKLGYYSYYIVFEYDGVTYTSTFTYKKDSEGKITNEIEKQVWNITENDLENNVIYSNAKEDNDNYVQTRNNFNAKFTTINSNGALDKDGNKTEIAYETKNKDGYIPQSIHQYNDNMAMQSSTDLINLGNVSEEQLQHVNLGLRGRDIFDLELTSDVAQVEINVNNQKGVYKYTNKVNLRKSDILSVAEDAANLESGDTRVVGENGEVKISGETTQSQGIRETDLDVDKTGATTDENKNTTAYDSAQGVQSIFVTYKINVKNASRTDGTATKITNYYDNKYEFKGAYANESDAASRNDNTLSSSEEKDLNNKYSYTTIETDWDKITQGNSKDIYVVYELRKSEYANISGDGMATYNMAEITEYKTECGEGQTEYTRGLIDKDSAPGSVATEKVRLHPDQIGNETTVEYYFGGNDLSVLKYEDDTYATPTLYFVSDESQRTITGTVFEDVTDKSNNIKSGNGKYDKDENKIEGVKVQLIEIIGDEEKTRYTVQSDENGQYTIEGFLPGNYKLVYSYGAEDETFFKEGVNEQSYNGEDFQSTNNNYEVDGVETNILSRKDQYWYLDNENVGISVATDNSDRRIEVSKNVTNFTDEQIDILNKVRNGEKPEGSSDIANKTKMYATTNKDMFFTVEKSKIQNNEVVPSSSFDEYIVKGMNFGIAEVPATDVLLTKEIDSFTITDATGKNIIAKASYNSETKQWSVDAGDVLPLTTDGADIQIEDEKLQGAKLQITYKIKSVINKEKNFDFDNSNVTISKITGIVDFIDNNLLYNPDLNRNSDNWELTNYDDIEAQIKEGYTDSERTDYKYEEKIDKGTFANINPKGKKYNTIVKAKDDNRILTGGETTITLEKVLSSTDSTIEQIITSTTEAFDYANNIEITGLSFEGKGKFNYRDRIRRIASSDDVDGKGYVILPGIQHDYAAAGSITIHPPTGDSSINIMYYIVAVISLIVLAGGVFVIKKFVIKK